MSGVVGSIGSKSGITGELFAGTISGGVNFSEMIGTITPLGMATVPVGWLLCDGTAVNRVTYVNLFTAIGTTWGVGDGSTTFSLPDLEGAFLRGTGSHGASNMADGNDFAGPSLAAFEDDAIQGHSHGIDYNNSSGNIAFSANAKAFATDTPAYGNVDAQNNYMIGDGTVTTDQGSPRINDENRPFNAGVKYCIKY
jgi:microcystin-dependent protein